MPFLSSALHLMPQKSGASPRSSNSLFSNCNSSLRVVAPHLNGFLVIFHAHTDSTSTSSPPGQHLGRHSGKRSTAPVVLFRDTAGHGPLGCKSKGSSPKVTLNYALFSWKHEKVDPLSEIHFLIR